MSESATPDPGERVLILAPTARDAEVCREILASAGVVGVVCKSLDALCDGIEGGAGAAILTQESIFRDKAGRLAATIAGQPRWSDFPLVVLTPAGHDSAGAGRALDAIGHMTLVKRPVSVQVLVSSLKAALRDRSRQYATRDYFVERGRQAEALRQRDERLRATFAHSSVGMAHATLSGHFLEVNPAFCAITGYPEGELLATTFESITHPDDRHPNSDLAARLIAGEVPGYGIEIRYLRKDGGTVWVQNSVSVIRDAEGRPANLVVLSEDVTERARAEAARLRSQDELRFALQTARMGSWEVDLATRTLACTDACKANYGRPPGSAFTYDDLFEAIHPADRDRVRDEFRRSIETRSDYEVEYRVGWPDESVHWVLSRGQAFYGQGGEPLRLVGLMLDITERKRAEEALQQADRRKDEFLAMLAHELRNPLAAISAATRVFATPELGAEDLEWGRGVLERQVRQLTRLIDDLLDVSRITSGKIRLRRESFDVSPVLGSAIEVVQPLIDERKHAMTVSMTPGPLRLFADPTRVEQILVNLLTNAAKYTESGGHITVTAGQDGGEVVFRVRDDGVGIPAELLPRLFDLFSQGDRSLARSEGGLGIGLTLVRALSEMHGGSVTVTSQGAGTGSEFVVRLPAATARVADTGPPDSATPKGTRGATRILVVDDNADAARGLSRLLKLLGHEVRVAHDGPAALQLASEYRPEVVLLDIGLPGMDGYEVASRMRREPWCRSVFLIAVTGYGQDQDRKRSHESGFDHHLVKPVDYDALTTLIGQPSRYQGPTGSGMDHGPLDSPR